MSLISPTLRPKAASSKGFCMSPLEQKNRKRLHQDASTTCRNEVNIAFPHVCCRRSMQAKLQATPLLAFNASFSPREKTEVTTLLSGSAVGFPLCDSCPVRSPAGDGNSA
eukprot:9468862-Pyramimonas_sp.AAC.2